MDGTFPRMRPSFFLGLVSLVLVASPVSMAQAVPAVVPEDGAEESMIPGVVLARPDGRFLGVETEGVTMRVTFYNREKEREPAEAVRISARWTDTRPRFTVLLPVTPETLVSPSVLSRPFSYIVFLALVGADDQVIETHSLRLR
jgi:hypothetical protein